jgi:hypothetical protein
LDPKKDTSRLIADLDRVVMISYRLHRAEINARIAADAR